jgi:hypothetical protein
MLVIAITHKDTMSIQRCDHTDLKLSARITIAGVDNPLTNIRLRWIDHGLTNASLCHRQRRRANYRSEQERAQAATASSEVTLVLGTLPRRLRLRRRRGASSSRSCSSIGMATICPKMSISMTAFCGVSIRRNIPA